MEMVVLLSMIPRLTVEMVIVSKMKHQKLYRRDRERGVQDRRRERHPPGPSL